MTELLLHILFGSLRREKRFYYCLEYFKVSTRKEYAKEFSIKDDIERQVNTIVFSTSFFQVYFNILQTFVWLLKFEG